MTQVTVDDVGRNDQILFNVMLQQSVGCIVPSSIGISQGNRTIAKAGTPLRLTFTNLNSNASLANATVLVNAVLLHDVDVTNGSNSGAALVFGFVDTSKIDSATLAKLNTAFGAAGSTPMIELINGNNVIS